MGIYLWKAPHNMLHLQNPLEHPRKKVWHRVADAMHHQGGLIAELLEQGMNLGEGDPERSYYYMMIHHDDFPLHATICLLYVYL